jgi:hypothetical protein
MSDITKTGIKSTNPEGEIIIREATGEIGIIVADDKKFTNAIYINKADLFKLVSKLKEML